MIGLFLGDTDFSDAVIKKIKKLNKKYFIIDFSKNNKFKKDTNSHRISIGKFGKIINLIKEKKSKKVLFAGKIAKPKFSTLRLDFKGVYYMPSILKAAKLGDAAIIKAIIKILENENNTNNIPNFLKKIILNKHLKMREDLMCFARVLSLVAHYESGMDYHLEIQLKSTFKFLLKMNDLHAVQKEMIIFLRNLGQIYPSDLQDAFRKLHTKLKVYEDHPYEKRAFLYLDILSWLESHLSGRPVADIMREKALLKIR